MAKPNLLDGLWEKNLSYRLRSPGLSAVGPDRQTGWPLQVSSS
jgi:hypothetical protein